MRPSVKVRIRHKKQLCIKTVKEYQKEKQKNAMSVGESTPRKFEICDSTEGILSRTDANKKRM